MENLRIVYRNLRSLAPFDRNARVHTDTQVGLIAGSISEFGFVNPILIGEDNTVIAGHGRVLAAQKLGFEKVPCVVLAHLSDRQRRALVIADNKIAMRSSWDMEKLSAELSELSELGVDLDLTGFDEQELDTILRAEIIIPEFTATKDPQEPEKKTVTFEASASPSGGDGNATRKRQFLVMVVCETEEHQGQTYDRLSEAGYICRIITEQ